MIKYRYLQPENPLQKDRLSLHTSLITVALSCEIAFKSCICASMMELVELILDNSINCVLLSDFTVFNFDYSTKHNQTEYWYNNTQYCNGSCALDCKQYMISAFNYRYSGIQQLL